MRTTDTCRCSRAWNHPLLRHHGHELVTRSLGFLHVGNDLAVAMMHDSDDELLPRVETTADVLAHLRPKEEEKELNRGTTMIQDEEDPIIFSTQKFVIQSLTSESGR